MSALTPEEEQQKRMIYDSMSPRRRKYVERIGYENWDPFQKPKDPIDIRVDKTKRTSQALVREFLQSRGHAEYTNEFGRGAFDICLGIINEDERYRGMFEFAVWYRDLLRKEGLEE